MDTSDQQTVDAIVDVFRSCRSVLFITGAGISADSGLPTYRGVGGLYDVDDTEDGLPIEEILSGAMFRRRPALTWKYLGQIALAARGATFNRAHEVIAEMERRLPRVWTLTQNVDGFHRLAGAENVIEIHGNLRSLTCTGCGRTQRVDDPLQLEIPPYCDDCRAILRPDVVLFGEMLPEEAVVELARQLRQGFDIVFSIGTSSVFPYIQEPLVLAQRQGVPTVEINPASTLVSGVADYRLEMGAAAALDAIWRGCRDR